MKTLCSFFCLTICLLTGCTMTDVVQVGASDNIHIPDRPYHCLGKVHAESWGIGFVYSAFLAGSAQNAKLAAEREARERGADAIINAACYAETHMPILMLIGWKEYHFSGDAIKYVAEGGVK